jgi:hypothetical protein
MVRDFKVSAAERGDVPYGLNRWGSVKIAAWKQAFGLFTWMPRRR